MDLQVLNTEKRGHALNMAPTRAGKGVGKLHAAPALGMNFTFFDPKGSSYAMSKAKAKKRLKAAGLSPAQANALVRSLAGKAFQGRVLQNAMRHHKRHARKWFPWDLLIRNT